MAWRQASRRDRARGVTLVEQVMVITVLAVLVGVASPSLAGLARRSRLQAAQMDFLEALAFARGEAVLERTRVVFCPSRDQRYCSDESRWESGWLVGVDRNHDNQPDAAPLRVGEAHGQLQIVSSDSRRRVSFLADGSAGGSNLTLLFGAAGHGGDSLGVVVSNSGRARGTRPSKKQALDCP